MEEILLPVLAAQKPESAIHHQSLDRPVLRHVRRLLLRKVIPGPLALPGLAMTGLDRPKIQHIMAVLRYQYDPSCPEYRQKRPQGKVNLNA
jgi:hypothetical protein